MSNVVELTMLALSSLFLSLYNLYASYKWRYWLNRYWEERQKVITYETCLQVIASDTPPLGLGDQEVAHLYRLTAAKVLAKVEKREGPPGGARG